MLATPTPGFGDFSWISVVNVGHVAPGSTGPNVYGAVTWTAAATTDPAITGGTATGTLSALPTLTDGKLPVLATAAIAKTGDYTVVSTDPDIEASGALTLTLHSASGNAGLERVISNVSALNTANQTTSAYLAAHTVNIVTQGSDVFGDGSTSKALAPGASLHLKVNLTGSKFLVL